MEPEERFRRDLLSARGIAGNFVEQPRKAPIASLEQCIEIAIGFRH